MKKILVVDDDRLVRESVKKILKIEGFDPTLANDAFDALKKVEKESYDLIISDIRMPGKDGVQAIREIRRLFDEKARKDIPIIFITGFAEIGQELQAENLSLHVGHCRYRGVGGAGDGDEAGRQGIDAVPVAHPHDVGDLLRGLSRQSPKEAPGAQDLDMGPSVLPAPGAPHLPPEEVGHDLHPVTDAENGYSEVEEAPGT